MLVVYASSQAPGVQRAARLGNPRRQGPFAVFEADETDGR